MNPRRTLLLALFAPGLALACNAISGIGDVIAEDPSEAGTANETGTPDAVETDDAVAPPPTCTCVAPAPPDWSGPIALLEAAGDAGRSCPTGLSAKVTGGADLSAGSDCMPCTCGTPTGTCNKAMVQLFAGTGCAVPCMNERPITTTCTQQTYCTATSSGNAYLVTDGGASCTPSPAAKRARSWTKSATACDFQAPFNDCPSGLACAPRSAGAPDAKSCIRRTGDHPCPEGSQYTLRSVFHANLLDGRSCSACSCGTANVTSCTPATVTFYNGSNCNMPADSWTTSGTCDTSVAFNDLAGSARITVPSTVIGSCPASGGNASGALAPQDPTTFCCLP